MSRSWRRCGAAVEVGCALPVVVRPDKCTNHGANDRPSKRDHVLLARGLDKRLATGFVVGALLAGIAILVGQANDWPTGPPRIVSMPKSTRPASNSGAITTYDTAHAQRDRMRPRLASSATAATPAEARMSCCPISTP
jgi:hypothetical protein